jgi:hypothetical protein
MDRIWNYRNNRYHNNTNQQVVRYKTDTLDRRYEEIWEKQAGLVEKQHTFQMKHFEDRQSIGNLNFESKHCCVNLLVSQPVLSGVPGFPQPHSKYIV